MIKTKEMLVQEKAEANSPMAKFKSTEATKQAAQKIALGIGTSVLQHIAEQLGSNGDPRFQENGSPTDQTDSELHELARDAVSDWLDTFLSQGLLDRDVVNEARVEMGLEPIS